MARKNLKEDPPSVSSEEESEVETTDEEKEETEQEPNDNEDEAGAEQEAEQEEEEGSDEEEEKKQPRSDAGDSSDSESEPATASDFTIKPIVSKPMPNSPAAKPKKSAPAQTPPKPTTRSKRPAAVSDPNPNDPKKKKAVRGGKRWSQGDVLVILKGIIDFEDKTGLKPTADPGSFYESVKNNFEVEEEVSQQQLFWKVSKLKVKFKKIVAEKGYAHVFTDPHEAESFELSKILWGAEVNGGASTSKKKKSKKESASGMKGRETVVAIGASASAEQDVGKQASASGEQDVGKQEKASAEQDVGKEEKAADKNKEKVKKKKVLVNEENADKNKEKVLTEENVMNNVVNKKEKKKEKAVMNADPDPDQYPCFMKFLSDEIEDSKESVLALIGRSKAKEFEDKCMKLQLEEAELSAKKSDVMRMMRKFRFEELDFHEKKLHLVAEQLKLLKDDVKE